MNKQDDLRGDNEEGKVVENRLAISRRGYENAKDKITAKNAPNEEDHSEKELQLVDVHIVIQLGDKSTVQLRYNNPEESDY